MALDPASAFIHRADMLADVLVHLPSVRLLELLVGMERARLAGNRAEALARHGIYAVVERQFQRFGGVDDHIFVIAVTASVRIGLTTSDE